VVAPPLTSPFPAQDKVAISKILGANAPVLEAIVFESVPPVPVSEEA